MARAPAVTIVFARAPTPGRAKSRLVPSLGAARAAHLQARLIRRTLRTARAAGPVELHVTPHLRPQFFVSLSKKHRLVMRAQRGADLGERMARALAGALKHHRAALLIGTDCPELRAADLRLAARSLAGGCDVVLAPAEDGGYALIGVRRSAPSIFDSVDWGGPHVYAQTIQRLERQGLRWRALRIVWDVDRPHDLARLRLRHFS